MAKCWLEQRWALTGRPAGGTAAGRRTGVMASPLLLTSTSTLAPKKRLMFACVKTSAGMPEATARP